jgi:heme-degrading monooxygenase HmoA
MLAGEAIILAGAQTTQKGIELHVDLSVDPAREKEMLQNFRTVFRPAASKQPGFVDVKILKLNDALQGSAPAGANYRFIISFGSEEQRKKWVATPTHQQVWPTIENTLRSKNYTVLLYEVG